MCSSPGLGFHKITKGYQQMTRVLSLVLWHTLQHSIKRQLLNNPEQLTARSFHVSQSTEAQNERATPANTPGSHLWNLRGHYRRSGVTPDAITSLADKKWTLPRVSSAPCCVRVTCLNAFCFPEHAVNPLHQR